jgi:Tol biopolymer transport system component
MDTGQRTTVLADVTLALRSYTDIRHAGGHSPAISPDGQWVAMLWESDNDSHVLFAVRRDGEDLRRISKGRILAPLSVSSVVPR